MIGKNQIDMNAASIKEAIEFYLNRQVFQPGSRVKVTHVIHNTRAPTDIFSIVIEPAGAESETKEEIAEVA